VREIMREYKFRGKRIDNGEWVYGYVYKDALIGCNILQTKPCLAAIMVDPSTAGQYTGLKDKNGREIYEGDIVEYKDFSGGLYLFREQPKTKGIIKINNLLKGIYLKGMGTFESNKAEIIGNIYDNPELLMEVE
jgi:uncharacterized phage protein (TIGR01671 family)